MLHAILKPTFRHYAAAFLIDLAVMAGGAAIPFVIFDKFHGGPEMSGAAAAGQSLVYAVLGLATARIAAKAANGLNWAFAGAGLFAIFFSITPLMPNVAMVCLCSAAGVGSLSLFWPAMWSWLGAEPDPAVRTRRISTYNVVWSAGLAVGPLVGGPLYDIHFYLPFAAIFAVSVAALLLVRSLPHERDYFGVDHRSGDSEEEITPERARDIALSEQHLRYGLCANFVGNVMLGAVMGVFPKRIDELFSEGALTLLPGTGPSAVSVSTMAGAATLFAILAFLISFARTITFWGMGKTQAWKHRFGLIIGIQLVASLIFFVMSQTHSYLLMLLSSCVIGLVGSATFSVSVTYCLSNPVLKHRRAAYNETAVGAGGFVGALGTGLLARALGIPVAYSLLPLFLFAFIGLQFILFAMSKRKSREAEGV